MTILNQQPCEQSFLSTRVLREQQTSISKAMRTIIQYIKDILLVAWTIDDLTNIVLGGNMSEANLNIKHLD